MTSSLRSIIRQSLLIACACALALPAYADSVEGLEKISLVGISKKNVASLPNLIDRGYEIRGVHLAYIILQKGTGSFMCETTSGRFPNAVSVVDILTNLMELPCTQLTKEK